MTEPTHETFEPPTEPSEPHEGRPQQTDNTEREIDPTQDVSQDPNVDYSKAVEETL